MWNPRTFGCECNKACKTNDYLDIKNCSSEKRLTGRLLLECEDEVLNTTAALLANKKVACAKGNCLIHTMSLVIICLLLVVVICVSCCFYYKKYRPYKAVITI